MTQKQIKEKIKQYNTDLQKLKSEKRSINSKKYKLVARLK